MTQAKEEFEKVLEELIREGHIIIAGEPKCVSLTTITMTQNYLATDKPEGMIIALIAPNKAFLIIKRSIAKKTLESLPDNSSILITFNSSNKENEILCSYLAISQVKEVKLDEILKIASAFI